MLWVVRWVALGAGCHRTEETTPGPDTGPDLYPVGVPVDVAVDGATVFSGTAGGPGLGLYQPPIAGDPCAASRRLAVFQGDEVYFDAVFPGEVPAAGSAVEMPADAASEATDWSAASWTADDGLSYAMYGGTATLGSFGTSSVVVTVVGATVCLSDRVGALDPAVDGTWATHTSDCAPTDEVVFRTVAPLPFDLGHAPWCAEGRGGSWSTPTGTLLCSQGAEPCP